jgi:[ribosomal protein S18]-alanine N-acetyltransferase
MNRDGLARIRPMRQADVDCVVGIASRLSQAPQWPRDAYEAMLYPGCAPERIALIAEIAESGSMAGFSVVCLMPPEAELEAIAVAAEFQRRGVARQLVQALADELRRAQVREILLEVRASNQPAQALYRSSGFTVEGVRRSYYADPVEDAVLMRLQITSPQPD